MTPLPDEQPLSRRQLREQQRTTDETTEPQPRRVSTTSAVPGGEIPDVTGADREPRAEPTLTEDEVNSLEQAAADGAPLTRRQARDLERVRTASVTIVPLVEPDDPADRTPTKPASENAAPTAPPAEEAVVDEGAKAPSKEAAEPVPASKPGKKPRTKKNAAQTPAAADDAPTASRLPSFVPASAAPASMVDAPSSSAGVATETPAVATEPPAKKRTSFGLPVEDDDVDVELFPELADDDDDQEEPRLSSSFGEAVLDRPAPARNERHTELEQPFDQIIARGLEEAGNGVGTSSLILPSMPAGDPFTGPLTAQGGVVVTGSIDIPSNGSSHKHPHAFDKSDIDSMFDEEDESRPATAGTPVSASRAVSTHTATRDVITPPAPARSNRLLLILAITAGVLAVAVLTVIIVGIAAGAFQSQ